MPRHPTARRVHRESDAPDDAFIARILELTAWAKQNTRVITMAAVVLVLALAAGLYYRNYKATLREHAAMQLAEVRQTAASGNRALAIRDLGAFIARFDGTSAAQEARLLLGRLQLEDGNPPDAAATVRPLAVDVARPLGASAAFLLAAAHEAAGEHEQAETVYLRIADGAAFPFQQRGALDAAARLRLERGDAAGAVDLYQRLVDATAANVPDRSIYLMRLAEAQARAANVPAAGS